MKVKLLLFLSLFLNISFVVRADNVQSTFWGCGFGSSTLALTEALKKAKMEPIPGEGSLYVKNAELSGMIYETVGFFFSSVDGGLYKVMGSNKFENKKSADSCYDVALGKVREAYPKLQILRNPEEAVKMCTYMDDDNVFYLALFTAKREGKKIYYVNINFWNKLRLKRFQESQQ